MIIVKGETYFTIVDATKTLGVSAKTIRGYIEKGIIPSPPVIRYGVRAIKHFPPEYMNRAKALLDNYQVVNDG
jgi:predicted site-specific integrase-resolvase